MNRIQYGLISRCLHMIYGQLLTDETGLGLRSVERLIALVRYMARSDSLSSTLEEELQVIRQVFRIYQPDFRAELDGLDPRRPVAGGTLLYEVCRHGIELLHSSCPLQSLTLFQAQEPQLSYVFTDGAGRTYGGMIYGEKLDLDGG